MFLCNEADLLKILELALIQNFAEDRGGGLNRGRGGEREKRRRTGGKANGQLGYTGKTLYSELEIL